MRRNHELRIKLSAEELAKIKAKSEQAHMSLSDLSRFLLLESYIEASSKSPPKRR